MSEFRRGQIWESIGPGAINTLFVREVDDEGVVFSYVGRPWEKCKADHYWFRSQFKLLHQVTVDGHVAPEAEQPPDYHRRRGDSYFRRTYGNVNAILHPIYKTADFTEEKPSDVLARLRLDLSNLRGKIGDVGRTNGVLDEALAPALGSLTTVIAYLYHEIEQLERLER